MKNIKTKVKAKCLVVSISTYQFKAGERPDLEVEAIKMFSGLYIDLSMEELKAIQELNYRLVVSISTYQ